MQPLGERARALLEIEEHYQRKRADLQRQYQTREITQALYTTETECLCSALRERMELERDYYQLAAVASTAAIPINGPIMALAAAAAALAATSAKLDATLGRVGCEAVGGDGAQISQNVTINGDPGDRDIGRYKAAMRERESTWRMPRCRMTLQLEPASARRCGCITT